ncbi:MAG TPA: SRPBCC family protein [Terriglobia bacterium]|nr:SRPBCC family protein [Terriglobia bacterium]
MILELIDSGLIQAHRAEVFHCFWRAELWPRLTSHVTGVEIVQEQDGWQRYAMEVQSDGKKYAMETERISVTPHAIAFHQPKPPGFMRAHTGVWSFEENGSGTKVKVTHRVDVDDEKALEILGLSSVAAAREKITANLHHNGMAMINAVGDFLASQEGKQLVSLQMAS